MDDGKIVRNISYKIKIVRITEDNLEVIKIPC